MPDADPGLTLVLTSPRLAPGLLSWPAWAAMRGADVVLAAADEPGLSATLAEASITLQVPAATAPAGLARELVTTAREAAVVWLGSPDGDPGLTDALADELSRVAVGADPPTVEIIVGSHDVPGARLLDLVAVMDRLRSPGGCPWDARQTHASLAPYLLEETYEAIEAIESHAAGEPGRRADLVEELGDVLLQVVFHARVGEEDPVEPFDIDEVAAGLVAKLVRRHPHVFAVEEADAVNAGAAVDAVDAVDAGEELDSADLVEARWEAIKAVEKGRASVFDGIPSTLPALARADAVLRRMSRSGQDQGRGTEDGSLTDPVTEPDEDPAAVVGARLLDLVRQSQAGGVDAETALRRAVRRLETQARETETMGAETMGADTRTKEAG